MKVNAIMSGKFAGGCEYYLYFASTSLFSVQNDCPSHFFTTPWTTWVCDMTLTHAFGFDASLKHLVLDAISIVIAKQPGSVVSLPAAVNHTHAIPSSCPTGLHPTASRSYQHSTTSHRNENHRRRCLAATRNRSPSPSMRLER